MASGSTAMSRKGCPNHALPDFTHSCQASVEHFQQCAEFPLLRNRGLGPFAMTVLPFRLPEGAPLPLDAAVFFLPFLVIREKVSFQ
jgi:hypothetical protein